MAGDFNSKLDKAQKVGGRLQSFLDTQEPDEDQTINQPHAPMPDFDPQKSSSLASAAPKRGATIPGRTARSLDFFGNRRDEEKDSYARALARYGEFT